jgi:hypothetical protein
MSSDFASLIRYALWSLSLSIERSNQHIVTNADGIQPLVRLLSAKSGQMREQVRGLHEGA